MLYATILIKKEQTMKQIEGIIYMDSVYASAKVSMLRNSLLLEIEEYARHIRKYIHKIIFVSIVLKGSMGMSCFTKISVSVQ
ncbi:MAG: hypothetical protein ACRCV3_03110 [Desulfovibrionaceae bacterium]